MARRGFLFRGHRPDSSTQRHSHVSSTDFCRERSMAFVPCPPLRRRARCTALRRACQAHFLSTRLSTVVEMVAPSQPQRWMSCIFMHLPCHYAGEEVSLVLTAKCARQEPTCMDKEVVSVSIDSGGTSRKERGWRGQSRREDCTIPPGLTFDQGTRARAWRRNWLGRLPDDGHQVSRLLALLLTAILQPMTRVINSASGAASMAGEGLFV